MTDAIRSPGARRLTTAALLAAIPLIGACATAPPPPTAALDAARTAIASAERADAGRYAGVDLGEAREKLANASRAADKDDARSADMITAERLAEESRVAAELATARTAAAKAAAINGQLDRDASALDAELQRAGDRQ